MTDTRDTNAATGEEWVRADTIPALLAEARAEALREAAMKANYAAMDASDPAYQDAFEEMEEVIRALLDAPAPAPAQPSVQEAARVLLDAMTRRPQLVDPFDAIDPEIEALAVKHSGNRGDPVIQLEIAEEFMLTALRALAGEVKQ